MVLDPFESIWLVDPVESDSGLVACIFNRSKEALVRSLEPGFKPKEAREGGDLTFLDAPTGSLSAMSFNYSVQETRTCKISETSSDTSSTNR